MDRNHCVISEVTFKDGNVPPIIGCFENGILKPKMGSIRKCGIFRNRNEMDKYIVAVHTNDNALYMGIEPKEEPYRNLLAVQDKRSNKVRLIEVDKVMLKPKSVVSSSTVNMPMSNSELYKTFGSKIIKRKTEQKERMAVNVESLSSQLQNTAKNIDIDNVLELVDSSEYEGTFLPCNRKATNVISVYDLNDIISVDELEELKNETSSILSNSDEDNVSNYSPFLNVNLKELPEENKFFCAKILLYAECLVQFLHQCGEKRTIEHDYILCPFSENINTKILDNFTSKTKKHRMITKQLKDKALGHAIVAGLLACEFKLHIKPLYDFIQTTQKKLLNRCKVIGAIPKSKENKNIIVLKLPLPAIKRPSIKKKKKSQ